MSDTMSSTLTLLYAKCPMGTQLVSLTLLFMNMFEYSCLVCVSLPRVVRVSPNSFQSITLAVPPYDLYIVTDFHDIM